MPWLQRLRVLSWEAVIIVHLFLSAYGYGMPFPNRRMGSPDGLPRYSARNLN